MESIGSRLKAAREAKNISIEQAQKDTRVSTRILTALETDRIEAVVSGPVYARSFIKKYANYLGLDGAALAESFTGSKPGLKEQMSTLTKEEGAFKFSLKTAALAVIALITVILAVKLAIFAGSRAVAFFKSRPATIQPVKSVKSPAAAVSIPQIPKSEELVLSVKTRADVYLKVKSDGSLVFDGMLKRGSDEKWKARNSFEVSTSRAEALTAELNGVSLGALGKGVVKGLKLPK